MGLVRVVAGGEVMWLGAAELTDRAVLGMEVMSSGTGWRGWAGAGIALGRAPGGCKMGWGGCSIPPGSKRGAGGSSSPPPAAMPTRAKR